MKWPRTSTDKRAIQLAARDALSGFHAWMGLAADGMLDASACPDETTRAHFRSLTQQQRDQLHRFSISPWSDGIVQVVPHTLVYENTNGHDPHVEGCVLVTYNTLLALLLTGRRARGCEIVVFAHKGVFAVRKTFVLH